MSEYLKKNKQMNISNSKEMESLAANPYIPNSALADVLSGKKGPSNEMMGHKTNLAPSIQAKMSSAFGMDFSGVKVYTSDFMAETGASGMAQGDKVVLSSDINLNSLSGQAILGHELSHIHAQAQGIGLGSSGLYSNAELEQQADMEGMMAAKGMSISGESSGMSMGFGMSDFGSLTPFGPGMSSTAGAPMQASDKPAARRARLKQAAIDYDNQQHKDEMERYGSLYREFATDFHNATANKDNNSKTENKIESFANYENKFINMELLSYQMRDNEYLSDHDREEILSNALNVTEEKNSKHVHFTSNDLIKEHSYLNTFLDTRYSDKYVKEDASKNNDLNYEKKMKEEKNKKKEKLYNRKRFNNIESPEFILNDVNNLNELTFPTGKGINETAGAANQAKVGKNDDVLTPAQIQERDNNVFDRNQHQTHYNETLQVLSSYVINWGDSKKAANGDIKNADYINDTKELQSYIDGIKGDTYLSDSDRVKLIRDLYQYKWINSDDFADMHRLFDTKYYKAINAKSPEEKDQILNTPISHRREKFKRNNEIDEYN